MLRFTVTTLTTTGPTTVTGPVEVSLHYHFDRLCTAFLHDVSADSLDGQGVLWGTPVLSVSQSGTGLTEFSDSLFGFALSVVDGTLTLGSTTGNCDFTGSRSTVPEGAFFSDNPFTSMNGRFSWPTFTMDGTTAIDGVLSGTLTLYNSGATTVSGVPGFASVSVGVACNPSSGDDGTALPL